MAIPGSLKLVCAILAFAVVFNAMDLEAAISCSNVVASLFPCAPYITGGSKDVSPDCCNSLRSLSSLVANGTREDRQDICKCLKNAATFPGVNFSQAEVVLGKCGVKLPFNISRSTNCTQL